MTRCIKVNNVKNLLYNIKHNNGGGAPREQRFRKHGSYADSSHSLGLSTGRFVPLQGVIRYPRPAVLLVTGTDSIYLVRPTRYSLDPATP